MDLGNNGTGEYCFYLYERPYKLNTNTQDYYNNICLYNLSVKSGEVVAKHWFKEVITGLDFTVATDSFASMYLTFLISM